MIKAAKYLFRCTRGLIIAIENLPFKKSNTTLNAKAVYFDLSNNLYERYLYLFVKFFLINNYNVFIKINFKFLGDFDIYSMLLFKEKNVRFCFVQPKGCEFVFSDKKNNGILLSHDYFSKHKTTKDFSVPMAMHPLIFYSNYYLEDIIDNERKNSVFFAGNFEEKQYSILKEARKFNICSRIELYDHLKQNPLTIVPESMDVLDNKSAENKIVIIDRKYFSVPMQNLRKTLGLYNFFMACPGISMPFSHNIIEAMSVGTIPLIQADYALLFEPPLQHLENAIVFERIADLDAIILFAFSMPENKKTTMRKNVLHYYNLHLSPTAVVENIVHLMPEKIYVNAEAHSVRLIN